MSEQEDIRVGIVGPSGRMGQRVTRLVSEFSDLSLTAGLCRGGSACEGKDVGTLAGCEPLGVTAVSSPGGAAAACDAMIDFSAPPVCGVLAQVCAGKGCAYVVGSTGLEPADHEALKLAAERVPVLLAANFSVGVNLLLDLVGRASRIMADADVEIFEAHHRHKRDAPSGTALALGKAVRDERPELREVLGRSGAVPRESNELGYAAVRGGDVSGEHTVFFFGEGERVELTHRATTPDIFARGALRAARWLVSQPAGFYTMADVLGGSTS